jgi:Rrf2 family protein
MIRMLTFSVAANLAVHSMVHLAGLERGVMQSAGQIAEQIGVSPSHLSKVLQALARGGLLQSTRGARGGFSFDADPQEVTLLEVIRAVDLPPNKDSCLLGEQICQAGGCKLKDLRDRVSRLVEGELASTTLAEFASTSGKSPDGTNRAAG